MKALHIEYVISWRQALRIITKFKVKKHAGAGYTFDLEPLDIQLTDVKMSSQLYQRLYSNSYSNTIELYRLRIYYEKPNGKNP